MINTHIAHFARHNRQLLENEGVVQEVLREVVERRRHDLGVGESRLDLLPAVGVLLR